MTDANTSARRMLVRVIAENMSIYARTINCDEFILQAEQLLYCFEAIEGRPANDYCEIEGWSRRHLKTRGRFLVLDGTK